MKNERRDFIKTAGIVALGTAALGAGSRIIADDNKSEPLGELTEHTLPELPYQYNALEPFIDEETMKLHHGIHHKGYVDGLNKSEKELALCRSTGDFSLIEHWSKKAAFNGGGHFLHSLFWTSMTPSSKIDPAQKGGVLPEGSLMKKISADFGSFESFKKHFSSAASSVEGSGWALLHYRPSDQRLIILQGENQHKLSPWGTTPILALDVWEHAYYLKYKNQRTAYIEAWWNVVNWSVVSTRYQTISKTTPS
jgi:Fe-Mn family superoxide dismutase